ncbi:hypothetical protein SDC9_138202 [bioreactor metagenome]|uniref:Uncharacterized protein n=1 Tax=bioreactor metagenome TaxID=1076179 RepID=A0A645DP54_9ZZZZ
MLDAIPRKLGDVHQTIHATDIDKRAVIGEVFDNTFVVFALFGLRPELFFLAFLLFRKDCTDRTDYTATAALDNLDAGGLFDQTAEIFAAAQRSLRCGNKDLDTFDVCHKATLDRLGDRRVENSAVLKCLFNLSPAGFGFEALFGEGDGAFLVINLDDNEFQLVTLLHRILQLNCGVLRPFGSGHKTSLLCADIHSDFARRDAGDDTGYDLAVEDRLQGLINHLLKAHLFVLYYLAHLVKYLLNYRRWR